MIINDLDVKGVAGAPYEADPPLFIDANAVLARPFSFEGLKPVARRCSKILKRVCGIEKNQLSKGDTLKIGWKTFGTGTRE